MVGFFGSKENVVISAYIRMNISIAAFVPLALEARPLKASPSLPTGCRYCDFTISCTTNVAITKELRKLCSSFLITMNK